MKHQGTMLIALGVLTGSVLWLASSGKKTPTPVTTSPALPPPDLQVTTYVPPPEPLVQTPVFLESAPPEPPPVVKTVIPVPVLDRNLRPEEVTAISYALSREEDPGNLTLFGNTFLRGYPIAAGLLLARAAQLRSAR